MMPAGLHRITEAEHIMKPSIFHPTHPVAATAICLAGICAVASVNLQANDSQVGRYSLLAATPTEAQAELLAARVTVRFPGRIQTVGEAVRYLLQRSGYRLASLEAIGPDTIALFTLPLPPPQKNDSALSPISPADLSISCRFGVLLALARLCQQMSKALSPG